MNMKPNESSILSEHSSAKALKRKADEHYYNIKGDVDEYTRNLFGSCTHDDARKEVNQIRSSSGLLPLTWAKIHLQDSVFLLLISKVLSGKKVKDAITDIEAIMTFDMPLSDIVKQHHPYDWMDKHRIVIKVSPEYQGIMRDIGLHKSVNLLANDKRPYTLLRRLERVVQRSMTYKAMEEELRDSDKQISQLKAELKVIQMRIAMTAYDIDALKRKLLEEPDPFERFKWAVSEFPDISNRDLASYCCVNERQIRRYRQLKNSDNCDILLTDK